MLKRMPALNPTRGSTKWLRNASRIGVPFDSSAPSLHWADEKLSIFPVQRSKFLKGHLVKSKWRFVSIFSLDSDFKSPFFDRLLLSVFMRCLVASQGWKSSRGFVSSASWTGTIVFIQIDFNRKLTREESDERSFASCLFASNPDFKDGARNYHCLWRSFFSSLASDEVGALIMFFMEDEFRFWFRQSVGDKVKLLEFKGIYGRKFISE